MMKNKILSLEELRKLEPPEGVDTFFRIDFEHKDGSLLEKLKCFKILDFLEKEGYTLIGLDTKKEFFTQRNIESLFLTVGINNKSVEEWLVNHPNPRLHRGADYVITSNTFIDYALSDDDAKPVNSGFSNFRFPIVTKVMPTTISQHLVPVQPMSSPMGTTGIQVNYPMKTITINTIL